MKIIAKGVKIVREEIYPSFPVGTVMSTDLWICKCGQWRKASEKCIHLHQGNSIIDSRSEELN